MSPSTTSNRAAALGLTAALIGGHEAVSPPISLRHEASTTRCLAFEIELDRDQVEIKRYIQEGLSKLPDTAGLRALAQVGTAAIPTLERLASDTGSPLSLRTDSIRAIGEIGGAGALPALTRILNMTCFDIHGSSLLRAAVEAISSTGDPAGPAILKDILQGRYRIISDSSAIDRLTAAWALGRFNSREAFEGLWGLAANPANSEEVRVAALAGLRRFGDLYGESQARLLALLENPGEFSRSTLLSNAAHFGLSEFVPELVATALDEEIPSKDRRDALSGLRHLKASEACEVVAPLLSSVDDDLAAETMSFLVSLGDPLHFEAVIGELRGNPDRLHRFPREEYVNRAVEDVDFLCATCAALEPVVQHAIIRCESSDLSVIQATDFGSVLGVAVSGLAYRVLTQETTLTGQLGGTISFGDITLLDSYMRLIVRYPVVAPSATVSNLALIAGICPDPFLRHIENPALPDHVRAAIAGAIVRSGNSEAIKRLDPALAQAFREAFSLRLSGVLPIDGGREPFFINKDSGDLLRAVDDLLENKKEISAISLKRALDPYLSIEERTTALRLIRSIGSGDSERVLKILSSPVEAIRVRMATRALMIAANKEIPTEVEARAGEIISPLVRRVCATNNSNLFFERLDHGVSDEVIAAAAHLYTPRFCVELLALADDERSGDSQEVLGLLNRKVMRDEGFQKFVESLVLASDDPSIPESERGRAKRYHRALVGARQIGMRSPFRFSIDLIERMVEDTQIRVDDKRPVVVVSFARADHNQAAVFFRQQLTEMSQRGFRILFMEPGDEVELVRQAGGLHSLLTASGIEGASALFIFGHGSKTRIGLGDKASDEIYSIDPSDRGELSAFGALLRVGGVVVHLSCENGRGGKGSGNMVEFHREDVFPQAGSMKIIAPRTPTTLSGVRIIYKDDEIIDVIFPVECFKG